MQIQMLQFNCRLYPIRRDSGGKSNLSYTNICPEKISLAERTNLTEIAFKSGDRTLLSTKFPNFKQSEKKKLDFLLSNPDIAGDGNHPAEKYKETIKETGVIPTFNKKHFTFEDYQKLSQKEKRIIRVLNGIGASLEDSGYDFNRDNHSINRDAERILNVALTTKNKLDKEYTNGYKLVGIGRSPAALVETMELLGADAVAIPFSKEIFVGYLSPYSPRMHFTAKDCEEYFKYFGIDKDFSQTGKTLIFTDYINNGDTKNCLELILKELKLDNKNTKFTEIMSLMPGKDVLLPDDYISFSDCFMHRIFDVYGRIERIASFIGDVNIIKSPELYKTLPETFMSKLFRCALYDLLAEKNLKHIGRL